MIRPVSAALPTADGVVPLRFIEPAHCPRCGLRFDARACGEADCGLAAERHHEARYAA